MSDKGIEELKFEMAQDLDSKTPWVDDGWSLDKVGGPFTPMKSGFTAGKWTREEPFIDQAERAMEAAYIKNRDEVAQSFASQNRKFVHVSKPPLGVLAYYKMLNLPLDEVYKAYNAKGTYRSNTQIS